LKRQGQPPEDALKLPMPLTAQFDPNQASEVLTAGGKASFEKVPPIGRQVKGGMPASPLEMLQKLAAALVPITVEYPLPFFRTGG